MWVVCVWGESSEWKIWGKHTSRLGNGAEMWGFIYGEERRRRWTWVGIRDRKRGKCPVTNVNGRHGRHVCRVLRGHSSIIHPTHYKFFNSFSFLFWLVITLMLLTIYAPSRSNPIYILHLQLHYLVLFY